MIVSKDSTLGEEIPTSWTVDSKSRDFCKEVRSAFFKFALLYDFKTVVKRSFYPGH